MVYSVVRLAGSGMSSVVSPMHRGTQLREPNSQRASLSSWDGSKAELSRRAWVQFLILQLSRSLFQGNIIKLTPEAISYTETLHY